MEKAKKEKEAQSVTPDYAAGLMSPAIPVSIRKLYTYMRRIGLKGT